MTSSFGNVFKAYELVKVLPKLVLVSNCCVDPNAVFDLDKVGRGIVRISLF